MLAVSCQVQKSCPNSIYNPASPFFLQLVGYLTPAFFAISLQISIDSLNCLITGPVKAGLSLSNECRLLINGDLDFFTPAIAVLVTVTLIDSIGSSCKQVSKHPEHTIFLRFKKKRGLE